MGANYESISAVAVSANLANLIIISGWMLQGVGGVEYSEDVSVGRASIERAIDVIILLWLLWIIVRYAFKKLANILGVGKS